MNEDLKEKLKLKIAISQMKEKEKMAMIDKKSKIIKIIGIATCIVGTTTGVVFAKNFGKIRNYFGIGRGIGKRNR